MAETVGRAEIDVDIDGRGLEQQVRALGQQIGRTLGRSIAQTFSRQMRQLSADVDASISRLGDKFDELGADIRRSGDSLNRFVEHSRNTTNEVDRLSDSLDRNSDSVDRNSSSWKELPHGLRQFLTYTAIFAAMGDEIAVLGSAAASSLTTVAGAFGAFGVGVGTTIAAFQNLNGEISELPEAVQPAAESFQALGDAFDILQDRIQIAALDNAVGAFDSLKATIDGLAPSFEVVGEAVGRVIDSFATSIAPGTQAFANLTTLIEASAPIFETLSTAAMTFGTALGNIFVASIPFVEQFASWLNTIATEFLNWTSSIEGQQTLQEWFQAGVDIMSALGPLVSAVAQALADLVTPETVAMTVEFINILTTFTPILGQILGVIGDLNILNIFAQLLLVIGQALEPVIPLLSETAALIGATLIEAILQLSPVLTELVVALAPVLASITQLAADLLIALLPAITALTPLFEPLAQVILAVVDAITPWIPLIAELVVQLINGLIPILMPLIELLLTLFDAFNPLVPVIVLLMQMALAPLMIVLEGVLPLVGKLIELVIKLSTPFLELIAPIMNVGTELGKTSGAFDVMSDATETAIDTIVGWADAAIGAIDNLIGWIDDAIDGFLSLFGLSSKAPSKPGGGGGGGGFAAGGVVSGAKYRLTGEAGPEAIVPLNRPLAMIDPSVRDLAAYAQGRGGSGGGASKIVNVEPGAIQVVSAAPAYQVGEAVLDRLVAAVAI